MMTIEEMVAKAKADGASDIHLICGIRPKYRVSGSLEDMLDEVMTPDDCIAAARFLCGDRYDEFDEVGHHHLGAFPFQDVRQMVVRHGHVFHQDFAHDAHLRLYHVFIHRDIVKFLDNIPAVGMEGAPGNLLPA